MFYVIVLDHMFCKATIYVLYKIQTWYFKKQFLSLVQYKYRPQVGQDTNALWSAPSFSQKLHRMRFSLNSGNRVNISFGSDDSSAFCLLVLLKGKDCCQLLYFPMNDFATTILKSSKEIQLPGFVYTMWLFTMAMSMASPNKI